MINFLFKAVFSNSIHNLLKVVDADKMQVQGWRSD